MVAPRPSAHHPALTCRPRYLGCRHSSSCMSKVSTISSPAYGCVQSKMGAYNQRWVHTTKDGCVQLRMGAYNQRWVCAAKDGCVQPKMGAYSQITTGGGAGTVRGWQGSWHAGAAPTSGASTSITQASPVQPAGSQAAIAAPAHQRQLRRCSAAGTDRPPASSC